MATLAGVNTVASSPGAVPAVVRGAGLIVAAQGAAAVLTAAVLVVRGLAGADQRAVNGYGTAGWFGIIGAAVLAAAWALLTGRRWGRGIAVFANLTLLPVAWYLGMGSHRWGYAGAVGAVAAAVLALLFSPAALRWLEQPRGRSGS